MKKGRNEDSKPDRKYPRGLRELKKLLLIAFRALIEVFIITSLRDSYRV
jgi:hypothetical protein